MERKRDDNRNEELEVTYANVDQSGRDLAQAPAQTMAVNGLQTKAATSEQE